MKQPTHALICCVQNDDIGIGIEPHVRLFNSKKEAEEYAVSKLIECKRYTLMTGYPGGYVSLGAPHRVCATRTEVLFDFAMNYLDSMGRFEVVPICQDLEEQDATGAETEIADLLDVLEFAEGALLDSFASEDGLDGEAARLIALMCSVLLVKHNRVSAYVEAGKGPKI